MVFTVGIAVEQIGSRGWKGMSAHQFPRTIRVTYKTAWFMFHRIREAVRNDDPVTFGSGGGTVEVDARQTHPKYHPVLTVL